MEGGLLTGLLHPVENLIQRDDATRLRVVAGARLHTYSHNGVRPARVRVHGRGLCAHAHTATSAPNRQWLYSIQTHKQKNNTIAQGVASDAVILHEHDE